MLADQGYLTGSKAMLLEKERTMQKWKRKREKNVLEVLGRMGKKSSQEKKKKKSREGEERKLNN